MSGAQDESVLDDIVSSEPVLVRVFAHGSSWVRQLPAVPPGETITVTVSHPRLLDIAQDELDRAGYCLAGVVEVVRAPGSGEVVDVLVPASVRLRQPDWWRELAGLAGRIFDLQFGPVRRLFEPAIDRHDVFRRGTTR